ncbi:Cytochrome bo(3) ubiquinol oxidase subunit 3 [Buchnera aphidicola (Cinara pseudotaxifoliae)]|uniref:Cytochrome bo(3) ubiquinol oxidase subunit 3 n=1 Tax=Buchnera aphidicola (Cinara pseudotaxifoliae) TaxID=655384 RepID=A0A451DHK2_9GAMM|nr:cytochrome c oxidase subunit 3 [Buchnera aphidicola]VFP86095.1 Cytochrome bo(3) ubiquinol oxidase subunit 3 [Buchnera aphidicola (Cinara pseudotaxifoliae)]
MNKKKRNISYFSLENKNIFGMWIYLMSDCIIFSILFIVHIIMSRHGYNDFLKENNLFSRPMIFLETFVLLCSSFFCSLTKHFLKKCSKKYVVISLLSTLVLGSIFLGLEVLEFLQILEKGFYPISNGYLSSFFVVLGAHSLHIILGLLWILVLISQIFVFGFSSFVNTSVICFCLFWHFLDIIWTILIACVYLK